MAKYPSYLSTYVAEEDPQGKELKGPAPRCGCEEGILRRAAPRCNSIARSLTSLFERARVFHRGAAGLSVLAVVIAVVVSHSEADRRIVFRAAKRKLKRATAGGGERWTMCAHTEEPSWSTGL